jgi:hypothetical protein
MIFPLLMYPHRYLPLVDTTSSFHGNQVQTLPCKIEAQISYHYLTAGLPSKTQSAKPEASSGKNDMQKRIENQLKIRQVCIGNIQADHLVKDADKVN